MKITIKLFAVYQEVLGVPELVWDLPETSTVREVCDRLLEQHPRLEQWRNLTRYGVNLNFVLIDTTLQDGDEVVLIPPVSGG